MTEANKNLTQDHSVFWKYLLCAVATSIALLAVIAIVVFFIVDVRFLSDSACRNVEQTEWYEAYTYCFYGKEWDKSTYLSVISEFYSTIIVVLISIQVIVSGAAFVYVRNTDRSVIARAIEDQLPDYFETIKADEHMKNLVSRVSGGTLEQLVAQKTADLQDKTSILAVKLSGLQGDYEALQSKVAELNGEIIMEGPDDEDLDDSDGW